MSNGFIQDLRHAVQQRIEGHKTTISRGMTDQGAYREHCGRIKEAEEFLKMIQEVHSKYMTSDQEDDDDDD